MRTQVADALFFRAHRLPLVWRPRERLGDAIDRKVVAGGTPRLGARLDALASPRRRLGNAMKTMLEKLKRPIIWNGGSSLYAVWVLQKMLICLLLVLLFINLFHILFTQYFIGYTRYQLTGISNIFCNIDIMQITYAGSVKKSRVKWTCILLARFPF